jgi:hypothetical protein
MGWTAEGISRRSWKSNPIYFAGTPGLDSQSQIYKMEDRCCRRTRASKSDCLLSFRKRPMASESLIKFLPFSRAINSLTIFRNSISVLFGVSGFRKRFDDSSSYTLPPLNSFSQEPSTLSCSGSAVVNNRPMPIPIFE